MNEHWLISISSYVIFLKVEAAVEGLSREILTIQARGDKAGAKSLLNEYAKMTQPLSSALEKLEKVQVRALCQDAIRDELF